MAKTKVPFEHSIAKQDRHFLTDNISVHPKPVNICYEISWHFICYELQFRRQMSQDK